MEKTEYNKLIINNKLNELSEIWNLYDLTRYTYLGKPLLEYLLKNKIHSTRMDNYVCKDKTWIDLYIKYNVVSPLVNVPLENLLLYQDKELFLETLLKKLNKNEKIDLFKNIYKNSYWLYRMNEGVIIKLFNRYGINLHKGFIDMPVINEKEIKSTTKLDKLLNQFVTAYDDTDEITLDVYISELKRNALVNREGTYSDILKLIDLKKKYPNFKLTLYEYLDDDEKNKGEYNSGKRRIIINENELGILSHELSHMIYDNYEDSDSNSKTNKKYKRIIREVINDDIINNIINYLKEFHMRYSEMEKYFKELYFAEIKKKYGSFNNYCKLIMIDIMVIKPDYIAIDYDRETKEYDTYLFPNEEKIGDDVIILVTDEMNKYVKIMVKNYYYEELMLENLLDAILKGDIWEEKYDVKSLSGHSSETYNEEKDASFNECLADYYAIKNSKKADILTNKLRKIVGNRLVNFLDKYIEENRDYKQKKLVR